MSEKECHEEIARLRSQVSALEQLLEVHEQTVIEQSDRIEESVNTIKEREARIRLLYEVTAQTALDIGAQLQEILALTAKLFGAEIGIISRVEENTYTVRYCYDPALTLKPGQTFNLADTYCIETLRTEGVLSIDNAAKSQYAQHPAYHRLQLESYIATPIWVRDQPYGTLSFSSREPRQQPFSQSDQQFIDLLARWVSSAIEREQLETQVQEMLDHRTKQVEISIEVAQEIAAVSALEQLFQQIVESIQSRFGYYSVFLYLLEDRQLTLQAASCPQDLPTEANLPIPLNTEQSIVAHVARTIEPILVSETSQTLINLSDSILPHTKAELSIPIVLHDRVLGVLDVQSSHPTGLTNEDLILLTGLCGQIAIAINQRRSETALNQSISLLQATLESTADGILVIDNQGHIPQFNQRFIDLWHVPQAIIETRDNQIVMAHMLGQLKDPTQFTVRMEELSTSPDLTSADILYLKDGRIFERHSLPQRIGNSIVGRVWSFRDITKRDHAEKALSASEARFRNLVASLSGHVYMTEIDTNGQPVNAYISPNVEELTGYPHQQFATDWAFWPRTVIHPEDRIIAEEQAAKLARGENSRLDYRLVKANGDIIWVNDNAQVLSDDEENRLTIYGVVTEITERKRAEQQIYRQREFLDKIVENLPVGVYAKSIKDDYRFSIWNAKMEALHANNRLDILGKNDYDLFDQEVADHNRKMDALIMQTGEVVDISQESLTIPRGEMTVHTVRVPLYDGEGNPETLLGIVEDISERTLAEQALRESEALLRAVIDATPDWIFIRDCNHRYRLVNQSYADSMNLSPDDFVGKDDLEIGFPEDYVKGNPAIGIRGFWPDDQNVLEREEIQTTNDVPAVFGGGMHYLSTVKVPLRNAEGQVDAVLGFVHDITDLKKVEQSLRESERQLARTLHIAQLAHWTFNFSTRQFLLNDPFYTLLNTSEADEQGYQIPMNEFCDKFVHSEDHSTLLDYINLAQATDDAEFAPQFECRMIQQGGQERYHRIQMQVEKDSYGNTTQASGILQDITEQKEAELDRERLMNELESTMRQYISREWTAYLQNFHDGNWRVEHCQTENYQNGKDLDLDTIHEAVLQTGEAKIITGQQEGSLQQNSAIVVPISLRGQVVGTMSLEDLDPDKRWTEDEIALIEAVLEQLALTIENLRLFEDTQRDAWRNKAVSESTAKVWSAAEIEAVMQAAVSQLGERLDASEVVIRLGTDVYSGQEAKASSS